jgi:hypothetical protein
LDYLDFIATPAFTAGFFVLDLSQKNDLFYNWYLRFHKSVLMGYIAYYFAIGVIFYGAYYCGIHIFNKDPNEIVERYISKNTPLWANKLLQAIVVAWFTHGFCTSRTIPGLGNTIELFIEKNLFRNFRSDLDDDKNKGRLNFARILIKRHDKKYVPSLDLTTFAKKIEAYVKDNRSTIKPAEMAILQVMSEDMESVSSINTAVFMALENFTPKKIKVILDI